MHSRSRPFTPASLPRLLAALGATFLAAPAASQDPPEPSRGLFLEPRVTVLASGERFVRIAPKAILGWELAAIPPARVVTPGPIPLSEGFGPGIAAGTVLGQELGPYGLAACLYPEVDAGSPPPLVCLFDRDGDGRSDRAEAGERSVPIEPVRLAPAGIATVHPAAATIERRIFVESVDGAVATIIPQWLVRPSEGLPNYGISIVGSQLPDPGPGRLKLSLRAGARVSVWGLGLEVGPGADGAWWVKVTGAMSQWVKLRPPGTVVDFAGGTLERSR